MSRTDRKLNYHTKKPSQASASKHLSPVNYEPQPSDPISKRPRDLHLSIPNEDEPDTVKHTAYDYKQNIFTTKTLQDYSVSDAKSDVLSLISHLKSFNEEDHVKSARAFESSLSTTLEYFSRSLGVDYSNAGMHNDLIKRCSDLELKNAVLEEKLAKLRKKFNDTREKKSETGNQDGHNFMQV